LPLSCPAPLRPVEIIPGHREHPFRDRAKTVRVPAGIAVRLQPGILFVFTPERCSRSPRNPVRLAPESATGPYLSAAFLCEKVLQEKDGVLTFVRLVDRFTRAKPDPQIPPLARQIQVSLVIAFKSGGFGPSKYLLKIRLYLSEAPNRILIEAENEMFFEGSPDQGVNSVFPFVLVPEEEGLYWIDVIELDRVITRVPFRVLFAAVQMPQPPRP
jgi:hypothetical protein